MKPCITTCPDIVPTHQGIAFLAGAIWVFVNPLGAFWALATVIGLLLILQGALVLITSIESS